LSDARARLFGDRSAEDTDQVVIEAPDIAENGRVVPVEVKVELPNPSSVSLFSDGNPFPLLARAHFTEAVLPRVAIRVKMGQSANLIALAESDGKLYRAVRAVKVTSGGCGG
jgi:sulfur-oxidizing protein SoxY